MSQYTINIQNDYTVPEGILTKEQYLEFVMNMAAISYMKQYNTATTDEGIQAACDTYNASVPQTDTKSE